MQQQRVRMSGQARRTTCFSDDGVCLYEGGRVCRIGGCVCVGLLVGEKRPLLSRCVLRCSEEVVLLIKRNVDV